MIQAAILVAAFLAANVVAAGVVLVLGLMFKLVDPGDSALPWIVIGLAGALAAYFFLKGLCFFAAERARLQCRAGRRGG